MKLNDMDCKYCVENADVKVKLPFYCKKLSHYVSKKDVANATSAFILISYQLIRKPTGNNSTARRLN